MVLDFVASDSPRNPSNAMEAAHMTQPKQQPYPRFLPDRYEIRNGKFGPYFHDKRGAVDMPLVDVLATLNRYALRKDQLRWYVETYGEQPT